MEPETTDIGFVVTECKLLITAEFYPPCEGLKGLDSYDYIIEERPFQIRFHIKNISEYYFKGTVLDAIDITFGSPSSTYEMVTRSVNKPKIKPLYVGQEDIHTIYVPHDISGSLLIEFKPRIVNLSKTLLYRINSENQQEELSGESYWRNSYNLTNMFNAKRELKQLKTNHFAKWISISILTVGVANLIFNVIMAWVHRGAS